MQHTLTLAASSNPAFACADHMSYCPLFLTASVTSSRALPAPGCVGSTILFSGPLRSFRAIRSSRSFSRELTRDLRGRAWTAGTAERREIIWCDINVERENRGKDFRTDKKKLRWSVWCARVESNMPLSSPWVSTMNSSSSAFFCRVDLYTTFDHS